VADDSGTFPLTVGVANELVTVTGGTHALIAPGQSMTPEQSNAKIFGFLVGQLRA